MLRTVQFQCLNCGALYQVLKCEAGPETDDRQITCRACGAPLVGRDGQSRPLNISFCGPPAR